MGTVLQADFTYINGRLESGVVVHVGSTGRIDQITRSQGGVDSIPNDKTGVSQHLSLESTNPGEFALPQARRKHRLRGRVLLPGFINAHSHSFQRLMRGRTEHRPLGRPDSNFWTWRDAMYRVTERIDPDDFEHCAAFTFMEMLRAGFTHVAEFHYLHHQFGGHAFDDPAELSRRLFRAADYAGIGITLLPVAYQRGGYEQTLTHAQRRFVHEDIDRYTTLFDEAREHCDVDARRPVNVGLAAHSVRALDRSFLRRLAELGEVGNYVLHSHVAEQVREIEECLAEHGLRPVELLGELGLLSERFTAVHATHLTDREISLLAETGASACICPTTERNLGDGLPRLREMTDAGVRLSIGSDSQVRIDPFAELRALENGERLRCQARSVLTDDRGQVAPRLMSAGTSDGSSATGLKHGAIAEGWRADLIAVDIETLAMEGIGQGNDKEDTLLAGLMLGGQCRDVTDVWVGGRHIISDGDHLRWEAARARYVEVADKLWRD